MPHHKPVSGDITIRILCKHVGFSISGRSGSHVRLSKMTAGGKVGTVVPDYDELKPGTLKGVLQLAKVDPDEFLPVCLSTFSPEVVFPSARSPQRARGGGCRPC